MKPNSCLYRAVKKVVEHQFGIRNLKSDVFDKYNNGDGVPCEIMVSVINEALKGNHIQVNAVYTTLSDPEYFDHPELLISGSAFIRYPFIMYTGGACRRGIGWRN